MFSFSDRASLVSLINKLASKKQLNDMEALLSANEDSSSLDKPLMDTGQAISTEEDTTSSDTNLCKALNGNNQDDNANTDIVTNGKEGDTADGTKAEVEAGENQVEGADLKTDKEVVSAKLVGSEIPKENEPSEPMDVDTPLAAEKITDKCEETSNVAGKPVECAAKEPTEVVADKSVKVSNESVKLAEDVKDFDKKSAEVKDEAIKKSSEDEKEVEKKPIKGTEKVDEKPSDTITEKPSKDNDKESTKSIVNDSLEKPIDKPGKNGKHTDKKPAELSNDTETNVSKTESKDSDKKPIEDSKKAPVDASNVTETIPIGDSKPELKTELVDSNTIDKKSSEKDAAKNKPSNLPGDLSVKPKSKPGSKLDEIFRNKINAPLNLSESKKRPLSSPEHNSEAKKPHLDSAEIKDKSETPMDVSASSKPVEEPCIVSDPIEEPVLVVKGEGNGEDNQDGNIEEVHNDDDNDCIVGETIEEPVMVFYGEGLGAECDTGNGKSDGEGKEEKTSSNSTTESVDPAKLEKKAPTVWSIDNICNTPTKPKTAPVNPTSSNDTSQSNFSGFFFGPGSLSKAEIQTKVLTSDLSSPSKSSSFGIDNLIQTNVKEPDKYNDVAMNLTTHHSSSTSAMSDQSSPSSKVPETPENLSIPKDKLSNSDMSPTDLTKEKLSPSSRFKQSDEQKLKSSPLNVANIISSANLLSEEKSRGIHAINDHASDLTDPKKSEITVASSEVKSSSPKLDLLSGKDSTNAGAKSQPSESKTTLKDSVNTTKVFDASKASASLSEAENADLSASKSDAKTTPLDSTSDLSAQGFSSLPKKDNKSSPPKKRFGLGHIAVEKDIEVSKKVLDPKNNEVETSVDLKNQKQINKPKENLCEVLPKKPKLDEQTDNLKSSGVTTTTKLEEPISKSNDISVENLATKSKEAIEKPSKDSDKGFISETREENNEKIEPQSATLNKDTDKTPEIEKEEKHSKKESQNLTENKTSERNLEPEKREEDSNLSKSKEETKLDNDKYDKKPTSVEKEATEKLKINESVTKNISKSNKSEKAETKDTKLDLKEGEKEPKKDSTKKENIVEEKSKNKETKTISNEKESAKDTACEVAHTSEKKDDKSEETNPKQQSDEVKAEIQEAPKEITLEKGEKPKEPQKENDKDSKNEKDNSEKIKPKDKLEKGKSKEEVSKDLSKEKRDDGEIKEHQKDKVLGEGDKQDSIQDLTTEKIPKDQSKIEKKALQEDKDKVATSEKDAPSKQTDEKEQKKSLEKGEKQKVDKNKLEKGSPKKQNELNKKEGKKNENELEKDKKETQNTNKEQKNSSKEIKKEAEEKAQDVENKIIKEDITPEPSETKSTLKDVNLETKEEKSMETESLDKSSENAEKLKPIKTSDELKEKEETKMEVDEEKETKPSKDSKSDEKDSDMKDESKPSTENISEVKSKPEDEVKIDEIKKEGPSACNDIIAQALAAMKPKEKVEDTPKEDISKEKVKEEVPKDKVKEEVEPKKKKLEKDDEDKDSQAANKRKRKISSQEDKSSEQSEDSDADAGGKRAKLRGKHML